MTTHNPKCLNVPRSVAERFELDLDTSNLAWISIGEPESTFVHINNAILNQSETLKISFSDFTKPEDIRPGDYPPTAEIAKEILTFILQNRGKNFIINCAAGISRSGAICKFLEDVFDYEWPEQYKKLSSPNRLLYNLLIDAIEVEIE